MRVIVGLLLSFSILSVAGAASADEVRVMTSGAFEAAYLALIPGFERSSGHRVVTVATSMGVGPEWIPNRVRRGEPADVVVLTAALIDDLIRDGFVVRDSRADLARSGIGMAIRAGAARPDISSTEALRQTLLEAESIAYSAQASGDYIYSELLPRLGIAAAVRPKTVRIERGRVGAAVARGEAAIGFQQISELLPIAGIEYVGPLPRDVQRTTVFSAAVTASSRRPEAARALISFFTSADSARAIEKSGMDPIHPRVPVRGPMTSPP